MVKLQKWKYTGNILRKEEDRWKRRIKGGYYGIKFKAKGDPKSAGGTNFERNWDHCGEGVLETG